MSEFIDHLGIQTVIDPSSFSTILEDAGVLEDFEMEREA